MSEEITVTYWAHFTEPSGTTKQEVTAEIATLREQLAEVEKERDELCGVKIAFDTQQRMIDSLTEQLATARADAFEEIATWHGEQGERWGSKLHSKCARTIRSLAEQPNPSRPRDWPEDFPHDNGMYMCKCSVCGEQFTGHKRRVVCKVCANKPKPETCKTCGGRKSVLFGDVDRAAGTPQPKTRRLACLNDLYHTEEYECPDCQQPTQQAHDDAMEKMGFERKEP